MDLGQSAALLSFVFVTMAGAYGLLMGACYVWLAEALAPQLALLGTALASIALALIAALAWKQRVRGL